MQINSICQRIRAWIRQQQLNSSSSSSRIQTTDRDETGREPLSRVLECSKQPPICKYTDAATAADNRFLFSLSECRLIPYAAAACLSFVLFVLYLVERTGQQQQRYVALYVACCMDVVLSILWWCNTTEQYSSSSSSSSSSSLYSRLLVLTYYFISSSHDTLLLYLMRCGVMQCDGDLVEIEQLFLQSLRCVMLLLAQPWSC